MVLALIASALAFHLIDVDFCSSREFHRAFGRFQHFYQAFDTED
jgi:hypothetical protein